VHPTPHAIEATQGSAHPSHGPHPPEFGAAESVILSVPAISCASRGVTPAIDTRARMTTSVSLMYRLTNIGRATVGARYWAESTLDL
jgi:hypothetical protein